MKTRVLRPAAFEGVDGAAASRYRAKRLGELRTHSDDMTKRRLRAAAKFRKCLRVHSA